MSAESSPWPTVPLKILAEDMRLGKMLDKQKNRGVLQPYLRNVNVRWFSFDFTDLKEMRFEDSEGERYQLRPGDLVVCEGGEPGRAAVWTGQITNAKIQKALHRIRFREDEYLPTFAMHYLRFGTLTNHFARYYTGTTIKHLTGESLSLLPFPLPPLNEQRRIVAKLEELFAELDAGVEELKRVRANLKRYRASVLKAAVTGELTAEWRTKQPNLEPASALLERILADRRSKWEGDQQAKFTSAGKAPPRDWQAKHVEPSGPDTSKLPALSDGWCWATLQQIASSLILGKMLDQSKHTAGKKLPYLRNINVRWGCFDLSDLKEMWFEEHELERFGLKEGDVLVCEGGEPGRAAVWYQERTEIKIQKAIHRIRMSGGTSPAYCVYLLEHYAKSGGMSRLFTGSTIKHLTGESIALLPIPLPPLAEQEVIVAEVEARLSDVTAAEAAVSASLIRAARLRQSILKEAFAGRLVPQDPTDEPASALLERIRAAKLAVPAKAPRGRKTKTVVHEPIVDLLAFAVTTATEVEALNRTKIQKFAAILQTHYGVIVVDRFLQAPYGPYAPELAEMEDVCAERGYFTTVAESKKTGNEYLYIPGPNAEAGHAAGVNRLGKHAAAAEKLLRIIRAMTTEEAELFATIYAVWNDLLLDGKPANEADIIAGVYAWNVAKAKFKPATIRSRIAWMREVRYVPTGRGKRTEPTKAKRAGKKT